MPYQVRFVATGTRDWIDMGVYKDIQDAMAKYDQLRQGRHRDRVYVVDIGNNETVEADTHPLRR